MLDTLITYLTTEAEAAGSVFRRGSGLQNLNEFLQIVFATSITDFRQRMDRCYKVYIEQEQHKMPTLRSKANDNGWIQTKTVPSTKLAGKIISFWCFSPGFG